MQLLHGFLQSGLLVKNAISGRAVQSQPADPVGFFLTCLLLVLFQLSELCLQTGHILLLVLGKLLLQGAAPGLGCGMRLPGGVISLLPLYGKLLQPALFPLQCGDLFLCFLPVGKGQ